MMPPLARVRRIIPPIFEPIIEVVAAEVEEHEAAGVMIVGIEAEIWIAISIGTGIGEMIDRHLFENLIEAEIETDGSGTVATIVTIFKAEDLLPHKAEDAHQTMDLEMGLATVEMAL